MVSVGLNDDGRAINMQVGETVTIRLSENATSGYRWTLNRFDENLFELLDVRLDYKSKAVGMSGYASFTLKGIQAGEGSVVLKNWRQWEGDKSVTRYFRLKIGIAP
jgi:inhibitor of cysteine peptidase